jgi:hypothetical protein
MRKNYEGVERFPAMLAEKGCLVRAGWIREFSIRK